ncbi:hypothetical protein [Mycobacterium florentinum]|nr:hypothetical protein [Mycobacterium florentinum]MCV7411700.1 hypothetical protein [Mycobacterium florentinum]
MPAGDGVDDEGWRYRFGNHAWHQQPPTEKLPDIIAFGKYFLRIALL